MSLQQDIENLRTAWQDLMYALAKETRLLNLTARLGMTERLWVRQAKARAQSAEDSSTRRGTGSSL